MAALEKTIKLTQAQYDTLAAGGTVGSYTGLNENYIYLVEDNDSDKVFYNLGPYDTKSGNTITRKTGYIRLDCSDITPHTNANGLRYYTINIGAGKTIQTNMSYLGYSSANIWNVSSYSKKWEYNSSDGNLSLLFSDANINVNDVFKMIIAYQLSSSSSESVDSSYFPEYGIPYADSLFPSTPSQNLLCVGPSFAMDSSFSCIDQTVTVPSGKGINWYGKVAQIYLPPGTYTMVLKSTQSNMSQNLGRIQVNDNPDMQDLGTLYVQSNLSGRRGWFSEPSTFTLTNYTTLYLRYCMDCKGNGTSLSSGAVSVGHSFNIAIYRGPYAAEYRPYDYSLGNFFDILYPVGSIYISTIDASPARLHGGSWTRIKGRFLLAMGSNAANTVTAYGSCAAGTMNRTTVKEMGGEVTHTLTESEMPSHHHGIDPDMANGASSPSNYRTFNSSAIVQQWYKDNGAQDPVGFGLTTNTGGGGAHNNIPPYYTVYMWERTA